MSRQPVAPLRTTFQVQNDLEERADAAIRGAYDRGFIIGEQVGARGVARAVDKAIGLGFVIGFAIGAVVIFAFTGWPA